MQPITEDDLAELTDLAVQRWSTARDPRVAEILSALVRHLHDFAKEVRLTEQEWMAAMRWLTAAGQSATTSARNSSSPRTCSG